MNASRSSPRFARPVARAAAVAAAVVLAAGSAAGQTTITTSTTISTTENYNSGLIVGGTSPGPTLTINSPAEITATRSDNSSFIVGSDSNPYATVIQNGGSVTTSPDGGNAQLYLGLNLTGSNTGYTGSASYTLNSGTITLGSTANTTAILGIGRSSDATFTQAGGMITVYRNDTVLFMSSGPNSSGIYTISGGTFEGIGSTGGGPGLGIAANTGSPQGTLTINGGAVAVQPGNTWLTVDSGTATVNLNAGTLALNGNVTRGRPSSGSTPNGTVNFTLGGGTLRPYDANLVVGPTTAANTAAFNITLADTTTSTITGVGWKTGTHAVTIDSPLVGTGNIDFAGGTVTLSAANLFSGSTTVSGGTLALGANGSFASSPTITIASGAALSLTSKTAAGFAFGAGQTLAGSGSVLLPSSGTGVSLAGFLAPGGTAAGTLGFANAGTFDIQSAITGANTGRLQFGLGSTGASDLVTVASGTLAIGSGLLNFDDFDFTNLTGFGQGTYTLFSAASLSGSLGSGTSGTINGLSSTLQTSGNTIQLVVVPEPAGLALAGLGVAAAAWALRRRTAAR